MRQPTMVRRGFLRRHAGRSLAAGLLVALSAACGEEPSSGSPVITAVTLSADRTQLYFAADGRTVTGLHVTSAYDDGSSRTDDFAQVAFTVSDEAVLQLSYFDTLGQPATETTGQPLVAGIGVGSAVVRATSRADAAIFGEATLAAAQLLGLTVTPNPGTGRTFETVQFTATASLQSASGAGTTDATAMVQWSSDNLGCADFGSSPPGLATVRAPFACVAPMHATYSPSIEADFELHGGGT